MTRNNLRDHLTWLLADATNRIPVAPQLPPARDQLTDLTPPDSLQTDGGTSRQEISTSSQSQTVRSIPANVQVCPPPPPPPVSRSKPNTVHVPATSNSELPGQRQVEAAGSEAMGRPSSSTKSSRPGLLLRQEPLLTPTSTTASSASTSLQREYAAFLSSRKKPPAFEPRPQGTSAAYRLMTPAASVPPDSALYETVDLTGAGDNSPGSPPAASGDPIRLWTEDHAKRVEPLCSKLPELPPAASGSQASNHAGTREQHVPTTPRRGKKRKSNEATHPSSAFLDEDFPDIDDFLSEEDIMRSRIKKTASSSPNKKKAKVRAGASQTPSRRCVPPSDEDSDEDVVPHSTPIANSGKRLEAARHRAASPLKKHESPAMSKNLHVPDAIGSLAPRAGNVMSKVARPSSPSSPRQAGSDARIIQDSDDEFLTPASRHTTQDDTERLGLGLGSTKENPDLIDDDVEVQTPSRVARRGQRSSPRTLRSKSVPEDGARTAHSHAAHSTAEADDILDLFLKDPTALDKQRELLAQKVKDNTIAYRQALRLKDAEGRQELKQQKEQLTQQQKALDNVGSEHRNYRDFLAKMDALLNRISNAYEQDLNTDEDEARLEEMHEQEEEHKRRLLERLDAAGINDARLFVPEEPSPACPAEGLIESTQTSFEQRVPRAMTVAHDHGGGGTQVILQTQVPNRSQVSAASPRRMHAPLPAVAPTSFDDYDMDDISPQPEDDELYFLENAYGQLPRTTMPTNPPARSQSQRLPDAPETLRPPRSTGKGKSPMSTLVRRTVEYISDYSDDLDESMSYLAQNVDLQDHSHSRGRSVATVRPPLSETSGNPTSRPANIQPKPAKRAQSSSLKPHFPADMMKFPWSSEVKRALKDRFRMSGFRHNQLEAINATLAAKDAFVLMPTGGGKSLCYQLPAVVSSGKTHGVTVVVSPLLSLMQDQIEHLEKLNIKAVSFNGDTTVRERNHIMSAFEESHPELIIQLLYVTPEMINKSDKFIDGLGTLYRKQKLARLVIDEAHCVSQWGHDFRPDYKALGNFRRKFPDVPVMALTATATQNVIMDVKHNLGIGRCEEFTQSFNRSNLYYEVRPKEKDNVNTIARLINDKFDGQAGIVYTLSRKSTEKIAEKLRDHGISAHHYHASMEKEDKIQVQRDWQKGRVKVVVATIAFGMGIDKPDVRFVIHHSVPKSLEGYYQETGRAGRDGQPSQCYLYFGFGDLAQLRKMIADGDGSYAQKERQRNMLNTVASFCDNQTDCRRVEVLRYFGERFDKADCGKNCDNCKNDDRFEMTDYSEIAAAALQVIEIQTRQTLNQCTEYLTAKKKITDYKEEAHEFYGIAKHLPNYEVHRILDRLAAEDALVEENVVNKKAGVAVQYFQVGPRADLFLCGERTLSLTTRVKRKESRATVSKGKKRATKTTAAGTTSETFPSTIVSSPTGKAGKGKRRQVAAALDSDDDFDGDGNVHEHDGFAVADDDTDDDFEEMPLPPKRHKARQQTLGPPIARDARVDELSDLQKALVGGFVQEALVFEENLRNQKNLRRPIFREQDLREMAIRVTVTLEEMRKIPGISLERVNKHGANFIPLIRQFKEQSQLVMGPDTQRAASAGPSGGDFVDLISDEDDDLFDNMDEDDDEGEISRHFPSASEDPGVQAFYNKLSQIQTEEASKQAKSSRSGSTGTKSQKGSWRGGGKRQYNGRKTSGSSAKVPKSNAGIRKKGGASTGQRFTSGGSTRNFSGGGGSGSGGVRGSGPSRSGGGISGIGLMRH